MKTSLTVFICSTYNDLIKEREAVLEAIRRLRLQYGAMEYFGANPDKSIKTCLEEVRKSDILVVIVGHRYGNFAHGRKVSFSEAEYKEGTRLGKPALVYLKDENTPVLPAHFERDTNKRLALEVFKERLQTQRTTASFTSVEDLAIRVAADLSAMINLLVHHEEAKQAESEDQIPSHYFATIDELLGSDRLIPAVEVGKIFLYRKEFDKSLRLFQYILEKSDPSHRDYYNILGNIAYSLNGLKRYKEALKYFTKVKRYSKRGKYFFPWHAIAQAWAIYNLEGKTDRYWKAIEYAKKRPEYKDDLARTTKLYPKIKDDLRIGKPFLKISKKASGKSAKKGGRK